MTWLSDEVGDLDEAVRDWLADDPDPETRQELSDLLDGDDRAELADRFSGLLGFGTAGLRGPMGAGPNRMNMAVVIRAASAVADWVHGGESHEGKLSNGGGSAGLPAVVVGFDARHRSRDFAETTAEVLAAAGVRAMILPGPTPTPVVSFAVPHLGAQAGIMVTASHNPRSDNGYKLYGADGRQIVAPTDSVISALMAAVASASAVPRTGPDDPDIVRLDGSVIDAYLRAAVGVLDPGSSSGVNVVHTALHGVVAGTFRRAVECGGFAAVTEVAEQTDPDPDFPSVAFPNPEEPGALDLGLALAAARGADMLLAHDPDGDRLGVAVPDPGRGHAGDQASWRVLRGDEIGVLLASHLISKGWMHGPTGPAVLVSTVVSSSMLADMAMAAEIPHVVSLTGFKWISRAPGPGRVLGFGYEEALGYCVGGVAPDKDGITAALVLMEMVADLKATERTVLDVLDDLAVAHGVHRTDQWVCRLGGLGARERLGGVMAELRSTPPTAIGPHRVVDVDDLGDGDLARGLEPADVLTFHLEAGRVVVRPSGTEPKLKCYVEVVEPVAGAGDLAAATARADASTESLVTAVAELIGSMSA